MRGDKLDAIAKYVLRKANVNYLGVFARDHIPNLHSVSYPCCFICNTDPSHLPGTHWVSFYLTNPSCIEFFDSYGLHPSTYGFTISITCHNTIQFQSIHSHVCGEYCIFFLYYRSHCKCSLTKNFDPNHLSRNDKKVARWVKSILNHSPIPLPKCKSQCIQSCKCRSH